MATRKRFTFILFGATGDLAVQKLFPALASLFERGQMILCERVIAVSRRDWDTKQFLDFLATEGKKAYPAGFFEKISYAKVDVEAGDGYEALAKMVDGEAIVYLSLAPSHHKPATLALKKAGVLRKGKGRLMIEKPFGTSESSAKDLNGATSFLGRNQLYRVDHYLGKAAVRAMAELHRTSSLADFISSDYLSSVRVRFFEEAGINGRGGSYDGVGAFRDVGQNHVLEMLAVLAADEDTSAARTSVLESLAPASKTCGLMRRGQYIGYRAEKGVRPDSDTETAFSAVMLPTHGKLRGVPVTIEGGKKMRSSEVYVEAAFKDIAGLPEKLTFSIRPHEEISILYRDGTKDIFDVDDGYDAYERVILAALEGDAGMFAGKDEVEALWRYGDQVIACWSEIPLDLYDNAHPF